MARTGNAAAHVDSELRDNLLTFIVAGHETTALSLAWALYLCGFDPAVQDRARDEAMAALGDRAATVADLPALPFCRRIVDEALRISARRLPPRGATALRADVLPRHGHAADLRCTGTTFCGPIRTA
ncbi:MAG: cytochrome P450 [Defluviimonas denitrificans]